MPRKQQEKQMRDQERTDTVVIVDDEEMVLTSLSSFLNLETQYIVKTFTSANKALKYIETNDIDIVISDLPKLR